jgi:hypothetical protein
VADTQGAQQQAQTASDPPPLHFLLLLSHRADAMHCLILRDYNREPAEFPTNVMEVVTLLVKSKKREKTD